MSESVTVLLPGSSPSVAVRTPDLALSDLILDYSPFDAFGHLGTDLKSLRFLVGVVEVESDNVVFPAVSELRYSRIFLLSDNTLLNLALTAAFRFGFFL